MNEDQNAEIVEATLEISRILQVIVNYAVGFDDDTTGTIAYQVPTSLLQVPDTQQIQQTQSEITYEIYRATGQLSESESYADIRLTSKTFTQLLGNVPPSYSTVIRPENPFLDIRRNARSMEVQRTSPFLTRVPPPTYGEIEYTWFRAINNTSSEQIMFGPDPIYMWCTRCFAAVITTTESQRSKFIHLTAVALCLCGCWPCCLLPYCISSCKNTNHYCPECNLLLGTYRPW